MARGGTCGDDGRAGAAEPGAGGGDPPDPEVIMPADRGSDQIVQLQEQIRQLKEAVVSHAVVDQAIGMIVALGRVTPDQGWAVLKEVSQHTNIKLRNVAEMILIWGRTGVMPTEICAVLEEVLDRRGPVQVPGAWPRITR
ncbi:ANTAR domain-containing protein [Streptomyces vinaceusdrappus]|nr:ANTAR domain-containing protein [Streptomyces vinaceusdrappus]